MSYNDSEIDANDLLKLIIINTLFILILEQSNLFQNMMDYDIRLSMYRLENLEYVCRHLFFTRDLHVGVVVQGNCEELERYFLQVIIPTKIWLIFIFFIKKKHYSAWVLLFLVQWRESLLRKFSLVITDRRNSKYD